MLRTRFAARPRNRHKPISCNPSVSAGNVIYSLGNGNKQHRVASECVGRGVSRLPACRLRCTVPAFDPSPRTGIRSTTHGSEGRLSLRKHGGVNMKVLLRVVFAVAAYIAEA